MASSKCIDLPPTAFVALDAKQLNVAVLLCVETVDDFKAVLRRMKPLAGHDKVLRGVPATHMYYVGLLDTHSTALLQYSDMGFGEAGGYQVVDEAKRFFNPKKTIKIGVGSDKKHLDDVLLSAQHD